jgi:alpha-beta hydrolase superfamily lysophospholipase
MIEIQHSEGWFQGKGGLRLYRQQWDPAGRAKAVLLVVHGLFEHSGRYHRFAEYFIPRGFAVCSYDHRGHGKSAGLHGYVNRFQDFIDDLDIYHQQLQRQYPGLPVFLFGHSIGGTISLAFSATHSPDFSGLLLSAAVTRPGSSVTRTSIFMARLLSMLVPSMGITPINASTISRDESVVTAYNSDSLVYRGKIRARLGAELIDMMERVLPEKIKQIKLPVLIMHGSEDRLSNIEGSHLVYDTIGSIDKTLKIYNGFYHEILNEPERAQVLQDIEIWLTAHLPAAAQQHQGQVS